MVPKGYWKKLKGDAVEQKKIIDWLGEELSIKSLDEW